MHRPNPLVAVRTSAPETDTVIAQLIAIRAELRAQTAEIAGLRADFRQYGICAADDDQTTLIDAAHVAYPARAFGAAEFFALALHEDATGARLRTLFSGMSPRSVGKALSAASNKRTSNGLVLRRVGENSAGAVWCVSIE